MATEQSCAISLARTDPDGTFNMGRLLQGHQ